MRPVLPRPCAIVAFALLALTAHTLHATDYYFDVNGATAGSGVVDGGVYNWLNDPNWSTDPLGATATTAAPFTYTGHDSDGDNATFVAGADAASSTFTVTVNGFMGVHNIAVNSGNLNVNVNGQNWVLNANQNSPAATWTVAAGASLAVTNGPLNMDGNSLALGVDGSASIAGLVNSSGSLMKSGAGTLAVTAGSNYSGGTIVNAGTLRIGDNQALGNTNASITVNSGGSLDVANNDLWNYAQPIVISGTGAGGIGAITKSTAGAGDLQQIRSIQLAGDATLGGTAGGRFDIGRGDWTGPVGDAPVHIFGGGHTLTISGNVYVGILANAQNLAGVVIANGAYAAPHNDNSFAGAPITIDGGTLTPWNDHTFADNISVTTNGGTIDDQGFSQTYTGILSGNGPLTKTSSGGGSSTVTFAGANTYSGTLTQVSGNIKFASTTGHAVLGNVVMTGNGFLLMGAPDQFGANSSLLFNSSPYAEMALYGNNQTIAGLASTNANCVLENSHGGFGPATASSTLTINQSGDSSYTGYIRDNTGNDNYSLSIVKTGAGTLTIQPGSNVSYTGSTTVNGGVLALGTADNNTSLVSVGSGGTLRLADTNVTFQRPYAINGGAVQITGGVHQHFVDITFTGGGSISTPGGAAYDGLGNYALDGNVHVVSGVATLGASVGIHTNSNPTFTVDSGAELDVTGTLRNGESNNARSITKNGAGLMVLSAPSGYSGGTLINAGTLRVQNQGLPATAIVINSPGVLQYDSSTSGSGFVDQGRADISGSGTVRITGANTVRFGAFGGNTINWNLSPGALIDVQSGTMIGGSNFNDNWTNNQASLSVAANALFQMVEANVTVDALSGAGMLSGGWYGPSTLTVGAAGGGGTFSGTLFDDGFGGGTLALSKVGAGTQTLAAINSYSAGTAVSGGTLRTTVGGANPGSVGALGSGSLTITATAGTSRVLLGGNETLAALTSNQSGAGVANLSAAAGQSVTITVMGSTRVSGALNVAGGGHLIINSNQVNLNDNAKIDIAANGTLKLVSNGSPNSSVGTGVQVTVETGSTLELAGTVSTLVDASAVSPGAVNPSRRAEVTLSGTLQLDPGAVQQVGGVHSVSNLAGSVLLLDDMTNTSSLTVDHVSIGSLTIGSGTKLVINPSLADGSPSVLATTGGFAQLPSSRQQFAGGAASLAASSLNSGSLGLVAVPEPSAIALALLASGCLLAARRRPRGL